jgi:tetratricopeptide (TPR) repeat protein
MQVNTDALAAEELVARLRPALSNGDLRDALEWVQKKWSPAQLLGLLENPSTDARKVAALALGMIGDKASVRPLAAALHDGDLMVAQIAEHSLWSIWFRLGKPPAVTLVKCGNTHLEHGNYESAIAKFSQAIAEDPGFAEARNQRAIAYYLTEQYGKSIADCMQTLVLMPQHFGAVAGMGHCHAHRGEWQDARKCYRLALAIHPRLDGVETSLEQIEQLIREHPDAS